MSTVAMFALILSLVFVLPAKFMVLTGLFINLLAISYDIAFRKRNLVNVVVFLVNASVCTVFYGFGVESILPYLGNFFYGALATMSLVSLALRKPFTLSGPPKDPWEWRFHMWNVAVIGLFQVVALVLSLVLMPHISYVILPMLVSISSAGLSYRIVKQVLDILDRRSAPATR